MEGKLLEWLKILGPIIISWPLVIVIVVIIFRKPVIALIKKFTETPESSMKVGPVEVQLGKRIIPEVNAKHVLEREYEKADLSDTIGEIRNQGPEPTVVGFSVAYAMQSTIYQNTGQKVELSPRGIYVTSQKYDEWADRPHEGTSLSGAMTAMQKVGAYLETDWPYETKNEPAHKRNPAYRISKYQKFQNIEDISASILSGKVVIVSINWTRDFAEARADGKVILRRYSSEAIGQGTICIVGYDAESAEFKFALSWGLNWGQSGFGFIRDSDLSQILIGAYIIDI